MREGRVVSKEHMVNHLYGWGDEVGANAIEVYVHRIRKKLEKERQNRAQAGTGRDRSQAPVI